MDTAQPSAAETNPNVQLQNAADAFLAFTNEEPVRKRDEKGRFTSDQPEVETDPEEIEGEQPPADELPEGDESEDEGEQEAVEETQPMPTSWPETEAEHWNSLPPETQAYLSKREGERDSAVNAKFQESANARKEADSAREAAAKVRDELTGQLDALISAITPVKPDPRAFGAGTRQFNQEAFYLAQSEYEQQAEALQELTTQRDSLKQQAEAEEAESQQKALKAHNEAFVPKLIEAIPDIQDQTKAPAIFQQVFDYAQENGVDKKWFEGDKVNEIPVGHILTYWKAMQYDALKASGAKPKPKPAPSVSPGVSSPRSAQKQAVKQKSWDRLEREGSLQAAAQVFKQSGF